MTSALQFFCVTTDDCKQQLWVATGSPEAAATAVLEAVPEGWTARCMDDVPAGRLCGLEILMPGEAREVSLWLDPRGTVH